MHSAVTLNESGTPNESEDAAWATVQIPLTPSELIQFCHKDVERLLRINPYLEFSRWERLQEDCYRFCGTNFSQGQPFDFDFTIRIEELADGLRLHYEDGLKSDTTFRIEPSEYGAKLTIHENYHTITAKELQLRQGEVDRSLTTWAGDIQKFLIMWKKWRWLGPWHWYMKYIWQKLKPSGRRITYMFWWITLVEIGLIALGVMIYLIEYR